ncbi:MAG: TRAP transporter TatT component family protein [Oligoflexia bacterium]|nr:TRAP transporter TatT component family protein [Oligoflexia bacterium]
MNLFFVQTTIPLLIAAVLTAQAADCRASTEGGDQAYRERKQEAQARVALNEYREALSAAPKDPDAGWRVGMACYFVGLRLTHDSGEREKLFAEGRDASLGAAKIAPGCAPCHFWAAINMALYGQEVGVFKMLFSLKDVEAHLKQSIEIDPTYASSGAFRLLGVIHEKLPGILGGSNRKAREYYSKAIETSPDEPLNYLFMARLLENHFDRLKDAENLAKKGLTLKNIPSERLESIEAQAELQSWLKMHAQP